MFIYREEQEAVQLVVSFRSKKQLRIYSFHWLTCKSFLICDGELSLWYIHGSNIHFVTNFNLLEGKQIETTAACQGFNGLYIVGDRRGNIYGYKLGVPNPILMIKKAHSYLGVTQLYNIDNQIISLGRDGIVKTFFLKNNALVHRFRDKVAISWLSAFVDGFLVGFSGNSFVVWDYDRRMTLFEHVCGGGHRSWDFLKGTVMIFAYVQGRVIKMVKYDFHKLCSVSVIGGFHTRAINSAKIISLSDDKFLVISGGEDTNLRISVFGEDYFSTLNIFKSHLSSIRCVCRYEIDENTNLFFSGGGRGQIICWKLSLRENVICNEEFSYYEKCDGELFESEIRVMDLQVLKLNENLYLFAAASDGNINVFSVSQENDKYKIELIKKLFHKSKCVTKICLMQAFETHILISVTTDGNMLFWDVTSINDSGIRPFKIFKVHQSGFASICFKFITNEKFLFLSGGDDASLVLNLFHLSKNESFDITKIYSFCDSYSHCAQITGTWITNDYLITTSIDQKVLLFKWVVEKDEVFVKISVRYNSAVADIQGMECHEMDDYFGIFVYGKGAEYIKCAKVN